MVLVLRLLPPHCGVFNVEEVRFKGGKKNERRRWRFVKQDFCYFAETFLAVNRETRRSGAGEGGGGASGLFVIVEFAQFPHRWDEWGSPSAL